MNTHADKTQENKNQSAANALSQKQSSSKTTFQFVDNRPEAIAQRRLQEFANNSPRVSQLQALQNMANNSPWAKQAAQLQIMADTHSAQQQQPVKKKENNTGLPDNLKTGMENLSGYSMDDVRVHYNSDKPAQLQAHAFAQGTDIHLASGQEKHLPHEAWHVVQQKQGRVKPTMQMKDKVNINDDAVLEKEADIMGTKAHLNTKNHEDPLLKYNQVTKAEIAQLLEKDAEKERTEVSNYFNLRIREIGNPFSPKHMGILKGILDEAKTVDEAKEQIRKIILEWNLELETDEVVDDSGALAVNTKDPMETLAYQVTTAKHYLVDIREMAFKRTEVDLSRFILCDLTKQLEFFLTKMYQMAARSKGLEDYSLLAVGSMARSEIFPFSDLDYAILFARTKRNLNLVEEVENYINLRLSLMGEPALDAIGQGSGEDVAKEHVTTKRDVLMDARVLHTTGGVGAMNEGAYYTTRSEELDKSEEREKNATALLDSESTKFSTKSGYLKYDTKDAKKGLLRMPVFMVRNLCFYFNLPFDPLNVWGRVNELVDKKYLHENLANEILQLVEFGSTLRLKLHHYYGEEKEEFMLNGKPEQPNVYRLSSEEQSQYDKIFPLLEKIESKSKSFAGARAVNLDDLVKGGMQVKDEKKDDEIYEEWKLSNDDILTIQKYLDEGEVYATFVKLNGENYTVDAVTGALKNSRGLQIFKTSSENPFAVA